MKIRILGSGTSSGVPRIGPDWGACDPAEPRNRRSRASAIVETATTRILIDTSPDLREQLLAAQVAHLDAVIWTHDHADHCHGIDDLRQVFHARGTPIPGYARAPTLDTLQGRFGYVFAGRYGYPSVVDAATLPDALSLCDVQVRVTDQPHGSIVSAGLRFDGEGASIGYATDFHEVTDGMRDLYRGVDVLVVDALRIEPHPTHPTLDQALAFIAEIAPREAVLIHMDHSMDYRTVAAMLPAGVVPGHDGLEVAA